MNKTYLKKVRAKRVATDLAFRKSARERQGRMKRAARASSGDLHGGDFVSPGGAAFHRALQRPTSDGKGRQADA